MTELIEVKSNGKIRAKKGTNTRSPYQHQKEAMNRLSIINEEESFSTLIVLPTGARFILMTGRKFLKIGISNLSFLLHWMPGAGKRGNVSC